MVKISLACVIEGKGEVFHVEIDDGLTVNQLKETIMKASPVAIERKATDLELLLKRDDGAWLDEASAVAMVKHLQTPLTFDEHGLLRGFPPMNVY
ncbi:hypothetical protein V7S43_008963 [Phytophthora oleae]|uniref:Crinkler effector protein N-terminal domain-containing protein n=1 Tax=Phytophthora oleae TaxID=2107226 RepID=A0ABD3FKQ7_9STRA